MLLSRDETSGSSSTKHAQTLHPHRRDHVSQGGPTSNLVRQLQDALAAIEAVVSELERQHQPSPSELALWEGVCRLLGIVRARHAASTPANPDRAKLPLTRRQWDVVQLLSTGLTRGEIANVLGIKLSTVQSNIAQAMERMDAHGEISLVNAARMLGML